MKTIILIKRYCRLVLIIPLLVLNSEVALAQDNPVAEAAQVLRPNTLNTASCQTLNRKASQATCSTNVRAGDEIWLASTRHLETATQNKSGITSSAILQSSVERF